MTQRTQNLGLIGLGILAIALILWAIRGAGAEPPTWDGADDVATTGAASVTEPTSTGTDGDTAETVTVTASGDQSPDETTEAPSPLETAASVLNSDDDIVLAVFGDSTSNNRSDWVHLWALDMAEHRPVRISHWDETSQETYVDVDVLSESGDGSAVTIWSGSQAGATADYISDRFGTMLPEAPDLVIYNFGHNNTVDNAVESLDSLRSQVTEKFGEVPTVVNLQNPEFDDANADVRESIEAWAADQDLATIDVAAAFEETGDPNGLLIDQLHPGDAGQQLWAETVADALDSQN